MFSTRGGRPHYVRQLITLQGVIFCLNSVMTKEPDDKQSVTVRLPTAMVERMDAWGKRKGVVKRSDVLRMLLTEALDADDARKIPRCGKRWRSVSPTIRRSAASRRPKRLRRTVDHGAGR